MLELKSAPVVKAGIYPSLRDGESTPAQDQSNGGRKER